MGDASYCYITSLNGELVQLAPHHGTPSSEAREVHDQFASKVLASNYPCMMGGQSIAEGRYGFSLLDELGEARSASATRDAISRFDAAFPATASTGRFASFIAVYRSPTEPTEETFEKRLWLHLQLMSAGDPCPWNAEVSPDPTNPKFSFSVSGRAYYVIGMHSASSRDARHFSYPTLVFNPHDQFESLRSSRVFDRIKTVTRRRDRQLQGSNNPMLADHGTVSEARQYSGRSVDDTWRCPFRARGEDLPAQTMEQQD